MRPRWRESSAALHVRTDGRYVVLGLSGKWRLGRVEPTGSRTLLRSRSGRHAYRTAESAMAAIDAAVPLTERSRTGRL